MHLCIFNNNKIIWGYEIIFHISNTHIIIVEYIWNNINAIKKINKQMFLVYFDKKTEHNKKIV